MKYTELGRTGLNVSKAGLGCGGHSRLGQSQGHTVDQSVNLVKSAMDMGINFIDTAAVYGTEEIVGQALKGERENAIISTKAVVRVGKDNRSVRAEELRESLENSLRNLETDYIDVFHLHAVSAAQYDYCRANLLPELQNLRTAGKIRFVGITEQFIKDTDHKMLEMALEDDFWDVMMVGFSLLNPSARERVFEVTQQKGIATLAMFAVRRALNNRDALRELLTGLIAAGELDEQKIDMDDPLGFLLSNEDASSIANAAYRFCSNEAGVDVVLTGTGNVDHLAQNVASITGPALCDASLERVAALFGHIDSVSGN